MSLDLFEKRALELAVETLDVDTTPELLSEPSSGAVELFQFDEDTKKALFFFIELSYYLQLIAHAHLNPDEEPGPELIQSLVFSRIRATYYMQYVDRSGRLPKDVANALFADQDKFVMTWEELMDTCGLSHEDIVESLSSIEPISGYHLLTEDEWSKHWEEISDPVDFANFYDSVNHAWLQANTEEDEDANEWQNAALMDVDSLTS